MSELTPKEISSWLRSRAEKLIQMADLLDGKNLPSLRSTPLTPDELEKSVSQKSGRINDLACRLGTTPESIKSLIYPASRVVVVDRGWLKLSDC